MSKEIIINRMYAGDYLLEGDNIGHEIINLYKADNGKNYIYLNSSGRIERTHLKNEITVLLVRYYAKGTYKILAKTEGISVPDCRQSELELSYGGVNLKKIFSNNRFRGKTDMDNVLVTFEAASVVKPAIPLYITDNPDAADTNTENGKTFFIRTKSGFGRQSLRQFFNKDDPQKADAFQDLYNIILNDHNGLWESGNTTTTISEISELEVGTDDHFNFLQIIRQEDHELAFSNMLAYFFSKKPEAFKIFASEVLGVKVQLPFSIEREKENIDLLVVY